MSRLSRRYENFQTKSTRHHENYLVVRVVMKIYRKCASSWKLFVSARHEHFQTKLRVVMRIVKPETVRRNENLCTYQ